MKKDKCKTIRCRGEPYIKVLGEWLCEKCWSEHCETDDNV